MGKSLGGSEQDSEELNEGTGTLCEELNKERVRALPNPYWPLVQVCAPCPDASHFWHLCVRLAGQGDVVQVPLLKLKHTCCAVGVHNKEEVEEPDPEPDLEDLANDANMRRKGIR